MKTIGNILKVLFSFPVLIATGILYIVFLCFYTYFDMPSALDWLGWLFFVSIIVIVVGVLIKWIYQMIK